MLVALWKLIGLRGQGWSIAVLLITYQHHDSTRRYDVDVTGKVECIDSFINRSNNLDIVAVPIKIQRSVKHAVENESTHCFSHKRGRLINTRHAWCRLSDLRLSRLQ